MYRARIMNGWATGSPAGLGSLTGLGIPISLAMNNNMKNNKNKTRCVHRDIFQMDINLVSLLVLCLRVYGLLQHQTQFLTMFFDKLLTKEV